MAKYKQGDEVRISITGFITATGDFLEVETDGGEFIDVFENDWDIEKLS